MNRAILIPGLLVLSTVLAGCPPSTGSLTVNITPAEAVTAGAQWQVDGGTWQASGATVTGLAPGDHTISYNDIIGWIEPADVQVSIAAGENWKYGGTYTLEVSTGSLTVNLQPQEAATAGAQWRVDGGTWQTSGVTVSGLAPGDHTVTFSDVVGWIRPADMQVSVAVNQTSNATGTYTAVPGSLTVELQPQEAVVAGAQWQVDGGPWQASGATVAGLLAGNHTVVFSDIAGWIRPADMQVSVAPGQATTTTGTYVAMPGLLTVELQPQEAVTAGAQWQVDGGAWQASGTIVAGLAPGLHTVTFSDVIGWTKPADMQVSVASEQTTTATGTYVIITPPGSLAVNLRPANAVAAGAQWQLANEDIWRNNGETISNLEPGTYRIHFQLAPAWIRPESREVEVASGQMTVSTATYTEQLGSSQYVVFGYNDLGMHCMNEDFSELMILPPYNTFHALVIRRGEDPEIVRSNVTIDYTIQSNTTSVTKTNFWDYEDMLFGASLPADIGLTGNGLSGMMVFDPAAGRNDWVVTGVPVTPIEDDGTENPYPLATITVAVGGQDTVQTQSVVPVSWEISCNLCHNEEGISTATNILRAHDRLHSTKLEQSKPVACGACHAQPALGWSGIPGRPSLSRAMHGSHASRMSLANLDVDCYACHPGIRTQCLRDVHFSSGMECTSCHGSMTDVADPSRLPWQTEPRCADCHPRVPRWGFEMEQPNTLYRDSKGHHGVHCSACHGSPHAITPTVQLADNMQAIALQGKPGKIDKCTVCHTQTPDESFDHRYEAEDDGGEGEGDKAFSPLP